MRHIKTYKVFEAFSDQIKMNQWIQQQEHGQYLTDICQDLRDDGYQIDVVYTNNNNLGILVWFTSTHLIPFSGKLKDTFDMMINYMESEGYEGELQYNDEATSYQGHWSRAAVFCGSGLQFLPSIAKKMKHFPNYRSYRIIFTKKKVLESKKNFTIDGVLCKYTDDEVEIGEYLNDIFQELRDEGFEIRIDDDVRTFYEIYIEPQSQSFEYGDRFIPFTDIKDTIDMSSSYMESHGYKHILFYWTFSDDSQSSGLNQHEGGWETLSDDQKTESHHAYKIRFYKG